MIRNQPNQIAWFRVVDSSGDPITGLTTTDFSGELRKDESVTPVVLIPANFREDRRGSYYYQLTTADTDANTLRFDISHTNASAIIDIVVYYTTLAPLTGPVTVDGFANANGETVSITVSDSQMPVFVGNFGRWFAANGNVSPNSVVNVDDAETTYNYFTNTGRNLQVSTSTLESQNAGIIVLVNNNSAKLGGFSTSASGDNNAEGYLKAMARDDVPAPSDLNQAGGTYDPSTDSLEAIAGSGGGLSQQDVRNAMELAATNGGPVAGSIDQYLLDIQGTGFDPSQASLQSLYNSSSTIEQVATAVITADLDASSSAVNSLAERVDAKVSEAGGGSGATPEQIWTHHTRELTSAAKITDDESAISMSFPGVIATVNSVNGGALETTSQLILSTGGVGPWTTGTAANASSSIKLLVPVNWPKPDTGTTQFVVQLTVRDDTGAPVNADAPPVITAEDFAGGSLDANWAGAITNPVTGSYERTYNVPDTHPETDVLFKASANIATEARTDAAVTTVATPINTSDLALETTSQSILATTDQFRFSVANQVDANALTGGGDCSGSGSLAVTIKIKDSSGNGIYAVDVWVKPRNQTNTVAGTLQTDFIGNVEFRLDPGDYDLYKQKSGWNFVNPEPFIVTETGAMLLA